MAAPTTTARTKPTGIVLENGSRSIFAFAANPNVNLFEMTCKPLSMDGGDSIVLTNMWNDDVHTKAPQDLVDFGDATFTFQYDPVVYDELMDLINVQTSITQHFPDGSTLDFYGYLRSADFDPLTRGEVPTGTATVVATNRDPVTKEEQRPVLTSVAGT